MYKLVLHGEQREAVEGQTGNWEGLWDESVLVSRTCCNKQPQTEWLKARDIYARSSRGQKSESKVS